MTTEQSAPPTFEATAPVLLAVILQTQNLRYWLISAWGLALIPVTGGMVAAAWWLVTILSAGWLRSLYERLVVKRAQAGWGRLPLVAMASAVAWAAGPALAWRSGHAFGTELAWLMLASGYQLTFTQLGHKPRDALLVTLPYSAVLVWMVSSTLLLEPRIGIAAVAAVIVLFGGLAFSVLYGSAADRQIVAGLQHKARLEALQYQVRPHFLFNSLNSVLLLSRAGRREEAEAMICDLADFLRKTLEERSRLEIPLRREIAFQQLYLAIETVRFSDRLKVVFNIPSDVEEALVPNLILQPLVENAISHGLSRAVGEMTVEIGARTHNGQLMIWVQDNARVEGPPRPGTGFGIDSVRARLQAHFGSRASLDVGPALPGWRCELVLPYQEL